LIDLPIWWQVTCGRGCESYLVAELAALGLGSQVTPAFRGAFINDLPRGVSLMEGLGPSHRNAVCRAVVRVR
jgi:hypothetical protein